MVSDVASVPPHEAMNFLLDGEPPDAENTTSWQLVEFTMESIGAFEAKTRLSELLDRAAKGESFEITKHGHPVARLVPAAIHDPRRAKQAVERLEALAAEVQPMSREDFRGAIHEGHRF